MACTPQVSELGIEPYIRGAIATKARNLDHKIVDQLRNVLFKSVPDQAGMDLVRSGAAGV